MHAQWLDELTPDQLWRYENPQWFMEKYFLDLNGQPKPDKTTEVVAVPVEHGRSRVRKICDSADKVSGLYYEVASGVTSAVYLGWSKTDVKTAVEGHSELAKREQKAKQDAIEEQRKMRERGRATSHEKYIEGAIGRNKKSKELCPIGSYIVDFESTQREWPATTENATIDIGRTETPGIFQWSFDFEMVEGAMVLGSHEADVETYCDQLDREAMPMRRRILPRKPN
jgi:hypothetical protein